MAEITVKQLAEHLERSIKDGKGDLPVYLVHPQSDSHAPLMQGDLLRANGKPIRYLLVPEVYEQIEMPKITN